MNQTLNSQVSQSEADFTWFLEGMDELYSSSLSAPQEEEKGRLLKNIHASYNKKLLLNYFRRQHDMKLLIFYIIHTEADERCSSLITFKFHDLTLLGVSYL